MSTNRARESNKAFEENGQWFKICNKGPECVADDPKQPIENFNKRKASVDGHTYACKECEKAQARKNYQRRKKEGKLELTPEQREARKEFYREYYRANKQRKKDYDEEYRQTEQGRENMRKAHARRRERISRQKGEPYQKWEVFERDTDEHGILRCQMPNCKVVIERVRDAHIDHITPIAHGGKDELGNVRTVCADCNLNRPKGETDSE